MKNYTKLPKSKVMWATTAIHKLGDISRDEGDHCHIFGEDGDNYVGNWITGYGFIEVRFPKSTTRDLTPEEAEEQKKIRYVLD